MLARISMRVGFAALLVLTMLALAGCENKMQKAQRLAREFNAAHPDYAAKCVNYAGIDNPAARKFLTGEKLTDQEAAAFTAQRKARDAECKPLTEQYDQILRAIFDAQQVPGTH